MDTVGSRSEPSLLKFLFIMVIVVAGLIYFFVSMGTGDWLWFSKNFAETPSTMVVYCYGETVQIEPGSGHFLALSEIMKSTLSGEKRWDSLSMSAETYQEYRSSPDAVAIEFFFPEAVRVHSRFKFFSNVDNLIIPLEGRHAITNPVFGRNDGLTTAGSLHLNSVKPFRDYLQDQQICSAQGSTG
ncbi:MAG TPA: hypothetical protein VI776_10260 [Anaerolineales bacterium]|nr:hypothetical protein [Anaerolineales bacterium]